jgi:ABC-type transport system substrate-binding protein
MENSLCTTFIKFLAVAAVAVITTATAQTNNQAGEPTSGWTYPVIKDYGPKNLKVVAIIHGSAGYSAMSNDVYRTKFGIDNPNLKVIEELKTAGVQLLLYGQTFHELDFS